MNYGDVSMIFSLHLKQQLQNACYMMYARMQLPKHGTSVIHIIARTTNILVNIKTRFENEKCSDLA